MGDESQDHQRPRRRKGDKLGARPQSPMERRSGKWGRRKEDQEIEQVLSTLTERLEQQGTILLQLGARMDKQETTTSEHLVDCKKARENTTTAIDQTRATMKDMHAENKAAIATVRQEIAVNTTKTDGIAARQSEVLGKLDRIGDYLAEDLDAADRRKKVGESLKELFADARAVLASPRLIWWVRIASAVVIGLSTLLLGPKVAHQLKEWIDLLPLPT